MAKDLSPTDLRKEVHELRDWFKETGMQGQRKWMRLGKVLAKIRDEGFWKGWKGPGGKTYQLFDDYVESETGFSKSKGYALLSVVDYLKLPASRLEELGKEACYCLARLGKEKPKSLERVVEQIEKESEKGPVTLTRVRTLVGVALEGSHLSNGRYINLDFLLNEDRVGVVYRALKVLQAEEPVDGDGAAARGVHLLSLCEEFLTDEEHQKTLKQLEKAGAFKPNSPFQIEE